MVDALLDKAFETSKNNQSELNTQFSTLVTSLTDQFQSLQAQAHQNDETRKTRLDNQIGAIAGHQDHLLEAVTKGVTETQAQSARMAEQHATLLQELSKVTESMATSSRHMDNSATQLGQLGSKVESASTLLGTRLNDIAGRMESTVIQTTELTVQQTEQAAAMQRLQDAIGLSMQDFREAAQLTQSTMIELKQRQAEWLSATRAEFTQLSETLREQVLKVENQARSWLESYSSQVNQQVSERMREWNTQSIQYATEMLRISQALSSVLDELEVRQA